ncbi:polyprenyl synthetase family protein [Pontixanthobacter aquaemixtae]|uniref:polyprenyl synthetase family protein n=1 Tax=Pontixanthobacter aquaemixtae TaxID=1958940 RepID=UPI00192710BE
MTPKTEPVLSEVPDTVLADGLKQIQREVDSAFDAFLPVPADSRARLVEAMRYGAIGGGKRVRPLLVVATAELFGVDRDVAVRAGCALEAIHVYSLIHDDLPCMDDDDLRHGKLTLHKKFDEATAVLAGDSLHDLAFEILSDVETSGDPFTRAELILTLAKASGMNGMAGGQMMDMMADDADYDLHAITRLQQLKTGALLAASVEVGAILGKVAPEGRAHLRAYARDIGLAFQIADDLLDHDGDEAKAGKALRKDDEQGKQTFVTLMGPEGAREQAKALSEQAVGHLASYGEDAALLRALARYIVERDR